MNVYDFDGTIYRGDSTKDFIWYVMRHHPMQLCQALPKMGRAVLRYKNGKITLTEFKGQFFCFLQKLTNVEQDIRRFWDTHEHKIKSWYWNQQKEDDLVISASPEFLLQEICSRMQIASLIATRMNSLTGEIDGENCKGEEKVRRYNEQFHNREIDSFYSDHQSDRYMADIAVKSYLVKGNSIMEWNNKG